jgi:hypothetical protein
MSAVFEHKDYDWLTLVTCEDYTEEFKGYTSRRIVRGTYTSRRVVKAVLISVIPEQ